MAKQPDKWEATFKLEPGESREALIARLEDCTKRFDLGVQACVEKADYPRACLHRKAASQLLELVESLKHDRDYQWSAPITPEEAAELELGQ